MIERDWDMDFDLVAWQALDRGWRKKWLSDAARRERDEDDVYAIRRQRYERGQTAWDIGLDPLMFDVTLWMAVEEIKPEHWDGVLFASRDVRHRVLSALLANAGLRRTLRLAPRHIWERALATNGALGTPAVMYEAVLPPPPVTRPRLATSAEGLALPFHRVTREAARPFHRWQSKHHMNTPVDLRVLEGGYLGNGDHSMPCSDLLVLREPLRPDKWPIPHDAALILHVANSQGALLFDWQVRRPAYLEAGAQEVWVIDTVDQRILRQRQGKRSVEARYRVPDQTASWDDESGEAVVVELQKLFGGNPKTTMTTHNQLGDFNTFSAAEFARLHRFETSWTVGQAPQWFSVSIAELLGRFKDELWQGILFGPEYQRDEILSALLANVGLYDVLKLAPQELWEQAVAPGSSPARRNGTLTEFFNDSPK